MSEVNKNIEVIIEIPVNSFLKYEFNQKSGLLELDRVLSSSMVYPGNYGYIPNTLADDGDCLDALVVVPYHINPMTSVKCRVIGALIMTDEKGIDEKIICVPSNKVDSNYSDILNVTDLHVNILNTIKHFFSNYKNTEKESWSKVDKYVGHNEASNIISKYKLDLKS